MNIAYNYACFSPVIGNELETPAVNELARDISRADWEMFLLQRGKELKQGMWREDEASLLITENNTFPSC